MGLNKQTKGNQMYGWINATWNPIRGRCSHMCKYCFIEDMAKRFNKPQEPIHLVEKELKTNLGEGNFIFVGSSTDMFSDEARENSGWIERAISHCNEYSNNTYLFQTKDPYNFFRFQGLFMDNAILGTTIETNRDTSKVSKAPHPNNRRDAMKNMFGRKMITIEPIMDFDLDILVGWIKDIKPEFVNIGADSCGHKLQEPSSEKIGQLIKELEKFTKVNLKSNLKRLYSEASK